MNESKSEASETPKPSPEVKVGSSIYDPKRRLDVANQKPGLKYRWVRKENVGRRRLMGYETVQDADSASGVKTNLGTRDGTMHATHDMVLMATRKENADAYHARVVEKSSARIRRDIEEARESLNRDSGGGKKHFFGGGTVERRR